MHAKDNSLLGKGTTKGSGGAIKNSTIGANVAIGETGHGGKERRTDRTDGLKGQT